MRNVSCVRSVGTMSSEFVYDKQAAEGDTEAGGTDVEVGAASTASSV
jgi:hypothetical protein